MELNHLKFSTTEVHDDEIIKSSFKAIIIFLFIYSFSHHL